MTEAGEVEGAQDLILAACFLVKLTTVKIVVKKSAVWPAEIFITHDIIFSMVTDISFHGD